MSFIPGLAGYDDMSFDSLFSRDELSDCQMSSQDYYRIQLLEASQRNNLQDMRNDAYVYRTMMECNGYSTLLSMEEYLDRGGSVAALECLFDMNLYVPNYSVVGMEGLGDALKSVWEWIKKKISQFGNWLANLFSDNKDVSAEVEKKAEETKEAAQNVNPQTMQAAVNDVATGNANNTTQMAPNGVAAPASTTGGNSIGKAIGNAVGTAATGIKNTIEAGKNAVNVAKNAPSNFVNDIKSGYNAATGNTSQPTATNSQGQIVAPKDIVDNIRRNHTKVIDLTKSDAMKQSIKKIVDMVGIGIDPNVIKEISNKKKYTEAIKKIQNTTKQISQFKGIAMVSIAVGLNAVKGSVASDAAIVQLVEKLNNMQTEFSNFAAEVTTKSFKARIDELNKVANTLSAMDNNLFNKASKQGGKKSKAYASSISQHQSLGDAASTLAGNNFGDSGNYGGDADNRYRAKFCVECIKSLVAASNEIKKISKEFAKGIIDFMDLIRQLCDFSAALQRVLNQANNSGQAANANNAANNNNNNNNQAQGGGQANPS